MAAVAKDTDTCVSPGHVSSAVSPDMLCFSAKAMLDKRMMFVD